MYAGGIAGQPTFGLLADRFDKRLVLALDSLGSAAGIFLFLSTTGHGAGVLLALVVFGLFTFSGFPLLLSLVAGYVPKGSSTTGNALVWGIGSTGGQAVGSLAVSLLMGIPRAPGSGLRDPRRHRCRHGGRHATPPADHPIQSDALVRMTRQAAWYVTVSAPRAGRWRHRTHTGAGRRPGWTRSM